MPTFDWVVQKGGPQSPAAEPTVAPALAAITVQESIAVAATFAKMFGIRWSARRVLEIADYEPLLARFHGAAKTKRYSALSPPGTVLPPWTATFSDCSFFSGELIHFCVIHRGAFDWVESLGAPAPPGSDFAYRRRLAQLAELLAPGGYLLTREYLPSPSGRPWVRLQTSLAHAGLDVCRRARLPDGSLVIASVRRKNQSKG